MSKVNLFWYKKKNSIGNFGDELGPYIVERLTGYTVQYTPVVKFNLKNIFHYGIGCLAGRYNKADLKDILYSFKKENILFTVGSILAVNKKESSHIWGAGVMNRNDVISKANFYAVRGKYSQKRLEELGLHVPETVGDPALLLPVLIKPNPKKYKLGIIPHFKHNSVVESVKGNGNTVVINLLDTVESVVAKITSCEYTISTSLHGIIVSHAYGIPSIWVKISDIPLTGDNIKFKDYFSSVAIPEYLPFEIDLAKTDVHRIIDTVKEDNTINSIQNNLKDIQKGLIDVAPFRVLKEFKV